MTTNGTQRKAHRAGAVAGCAAALALSLGGCKSNNANAPIVNGNDPNAQDPAMANMAQPYTGGTSGGYTTSGQNNTQVMGQSESYNGQSSGEEYGYNQQSAPIVRGTPSGAAAPSYDSGYSNGYNSGDNAGYDNGYNSGYTDAEEAGAEAIADTDQAPPPLPTYDQPPAPEPDYLWTPGYWNYQNTGYYWVPGAWVAPPYYGALWTPPWWGFGSNHWYFHRGYWGPHVGFYGGINYGFGYIGTGYFGGYWHNRDFYYNRAVTNVNINVVHNVYNRTVIYNNVRYTAITNNRISYNGGRGGIDVRPNPAQMAAMHEAHFAPVPAQRQVRMEAAANRGQFFAANGGHPAAAFQPHPVGSARNIAAAPREQPFNHPGAPVAGRPGEPGFNPGNRPGAQPNFGANRPGPQPNFGANRPGAPNVVRPAQPNVPGARPGVAAAPGANGARPGFAPNDRNLEARPGAPNAAPGRPGFVPNDRNPGARPGEPNNAPGRPAPTINRAPAAAPRPEERPTPAGRPAPAPAPQFHPAPQQQHAAPAPQFHPEPQQHAAPAPQFHPAPQQHAAPQFHPAPQEHAAPAPRPGPPPAAHGGGGEHHR